MKWRWRGRDFRDDSVLVGETGCAQPVGDGREGEQAARERERWKKISVRAREC